MKLKEGKPRLEALRAIRENKPGAIFTTRDADAVTKLIDELTDAVIFLHERVAPSRLKLQKEKRYLLEVEALMAETLSS